MDLFGRFRKLDSSLQRGLDNGFARVFGGEVVPAEIDELLKQEVEDALMEDNSGALYAPSTYAVHLAARDHDSLVSQRPDLDHELRDRLNRFIRNEGWTTSAPVTVDLIRDDSMHTGQLKCRSGFTPTPQGQPAPAQQSSPEQGSKQTPDHSPSRVTRPRADDPSPKGPTAGRGAPEWPRSEPDSGRSPVARPYDAGSHKADGVQGAHGTQGAGAAGGAGSLAGLAHPQRHTPAPEHGGQQDAPASTASPASSGSPASPAPVPAPTEVVPGPPSDPVNGVDGLQSTGSAGYQAAPQRTVTLLLQDGSNRTYVLSQGNNTVGRGNQADFRLPDTGVSRRHIDITWDGFDAVLTDLNSTNGTTVNEIPVENWLLADGDVVSLGHSDIEVRFS